jgi:hypothetical protein
MTPTLLIGAVALGAALGAAHFLSLWGCVALMREGRTGLGVALQGLRFALLAVALVAVARLNADLFLPAVAGLLVVRVVLTRRYRRLA